MMLCYSISKWVSTYAQPHSTRHGRSHGIASMPRDALKTKLTFLENQSTARCSQESNSLAHFSDLLAARASSFQFRFATCALAHPNQRACAYAYQLRLPTELTNFDAIMISIFGAKWKFWKCGRWCILFKIWKLRKQMPERGCAVNVNRSLCDVSDAMECQRQSDLSVTQFA